MVIQFKMTSLKTYIRHVETEQVTVRTMSLKKNKEGYVGGGVGRRKGKGQTM